MTDSPSGGSVRFTHVAIGRDEPEIVDVALHTASRLRTCGVTIKPGWRVAIALGSRGIASLEVVVAELITWVRQQGAEPFIVPAMGSHGGATASGQAEVLASYGFTPEVMGCAVLAGMDVVELARGDAPVPVFIDRFAAQADATIVVNRVKPHTDFHGPVESGLLKMAAIGLGNRVQAQALHAHGTHGLRDLMPRVARQVLSAGNIVMGVALVENSRHHTMIVDPIGVDHIEHREHELLDVARSHMPRLPVDRLDVLVIDQMGKDISGVGLDTNVIGRLMVVGEPEPAEPRISMISCHRLTPASHGNATGVGLADVVTRALADSIDHAATCENIVTSGFMLRGKLPVIADNDLQAWEFCCRGAGVIDRRGVRAARIVDTVHLAEMWVSDAVLSDLAGHHDIGVLRSDLQLHDAEGNLNAFE